MSSIIYIVSVICILFAIFHIPAADAEDGPIVKIAQGKLRGKSLKSREGRPYNAFLNVPYGTANRFENPERAKSWDGIYNAAEMGKECAQSSWFTYESSGIEDCLKLNIYTPKNSEGNKYPVMVYFHGGGFTIGTANYYHGDYFMDENVVLVMVNYRLGPFGFLSTGDGVISGNFGLKDQNMALQFVAENIAQFGGDAESVTLFGNSAGGASVNFHILSPLSKGLFTGAISQSGSVFNPWAYTKPPKYMAEKFGRALKCPVDSESLLSCLQKKSTEEILAGMKLTNEWGLDPFTPFGPTIEPWDSEGAFLIEDPDVLMESGRFNKVPWLTGLVEDEGILMHSAFILDHADLAEDFKLNWRKIFPITLEYNQLYEDISSDRQKEVTEKIYKFYFGKKSLGEETRQAMTDMFSDRFFNHGVKKAALLAAKHIPVYPYIFAHKRGDFTILEFLGIKGNFGASHADELSYQFSQTFDMAPDFQKGSSGETVSKNFIKLWVSFARDGKPTAFWGPATSFEAINDAQISEDEPVKYYWINEKTSVKKEKFTERLEFWDALIDNFFLDNEETQLDREEL